MLMPRDKSTKLVSKSLMCACSRLDRKSLKWHADESRSDARLPIVEVAPSVDTHQIHQWRRTIRELAGGSANQLRTQMQRRIRLMVAFIVKLDNTFVRGMIASVVSDLLQQATHDSRNVIKLSACISIGAITVEVNDLF